MTGTDPEPPLREEWDGEILLLTLNRPDAYNAIDAGLRDALLAALDRADTERARCVVLRGAGRGFCAGADLKASAAARRGTEVAATMRPSTSRLAERIIACPVPVIASVHGVCAGVGLTLALAADHCVATEDAKFFAAFTKRALLADGAITYLLPRLVGLARARRMLLFGESVLAPEALELGMIGEVAGDLAEATSRRAGELAGLPTQALTLVKSMLNRSFDIGLDTVLFEERTGQGLLSTTDDYAEGVTAFRERRDARFTGR
jgi:2-(1,2-epoxy-1,2-dihydrophenyl)acetyl-CoA isomerase